MSRTARALRGKSRSSASAETATQRGNLYGFLARIFLTEPSADLLRRIREPTLRKALLAAGVTLGPELLDGPDDRVLEDMAVEYTRLFLGPGKHVPPYESVHARGGGGQLWGAETAIVKRDIEAAGFEYAATFSGLPDHIGIEMEFMAILAAMEAAALKDGDTARALSCLRHQGEFMSRHLAAWAPTFCRRVAEQAMLPFYRQIAELAGAFISTDETEMANRLAVALSPSGDGPQASAGGKTG